MILQVQLPFLSRILSSKFYTFQTLDMLHSKNIARAKLPKENLPNLVSENSQIYAWCRCRQGVDGYGVTDTASREVKLWVFDWMVHLEDHPMTDVSGS